MDWIIGISEEERASRALRLHTAQAAYKALYTHGCVLLRGVFAPAAIDALHAEFTARYGGLGLSGMQEEARKLPPNLATEVGDGRFEIAPRMNGPFATPELFANGILCGFLARLLGPDMRLSGLTAVVSYPGASAQHLHQDHNHLFAEPGIGPNLPTYAVNVSVPLIDVDLATGPTAICFGSHRRLANDSPSPESAVAIPFERGDCILIDYRTYHMGTPHRGTRVRPILYMVYARTWFFDEVNHPTRTPLDMSFEEYNALPESVRPLLQRAFVQTMRARQLGAERP